MSLLRSVSYTLVVVCLFATVRASGQASCTLSTTNQTVTICTPADGATVGTTFHVNAGTTDTAKVKFVELYVNYVRYAIQYSNYLDTVVTVPPGQKAHFTVQAYDSTGVYLKTAIHVNVTSSFSISPANPTVNEGATQQFTATAPSNWSASCGTVDSTGLFTAPMSAGTCFITATATDGSVSASTTVTLNVPTYSISPLNPTVQEGATQQFTATAPTNWSATCGSIDPTGLYTAPLTTATCGITGSSTNGSGSASTNVVVSSPISITPSSASTTVNTTQQFSANSAVNWSASCGSITSGGLFTAPGTPGSCIVTAAAATGTTFTATAADTVTAAVIPQNYTTWKYDNARDGLNPNETILTPSVVNSNNFGQLATVTVDGKIWAQPLYMAGVTINGVQHNVVYVATSNDSVYAFDGDTGTQLWKVSLLQSGEAAPNGPNIHSAVGTYIGVTGTPVIDPTSATLYAVAESSASGAYYHRLHALDITSGAEKFGAPVPISYSGFQSIQQLQRPGLLLANGNVYVAFGSNGDYPPYHGWLFAFNATNLSQVAVWNSTPTLDAGAFWMGGAGLAADANGNLFGVTANGDWDGSQNFGQSVVELGPTFGLLDYFTPINHHTESVDDKDLGSGGITLLPTSTGAYPHEAVNCSKLDVIYVLNRDHLGEIGSTQDNVVQQVSDQLGGTSGTQFGDRCFSNPAFWNNNLYFIGNNDVLKQFSFNPSTGTMSTTPNSQDTFEYIFPGAQPVVSSNGNTNAIVWATDFATGALHAYDATNVSSELYNGASLGGAVKFVVPTVINGHVYVGMSNKLAIYGVFPAPYCAPPTSPGATVCAPVAGSSYSSPVAVSAAGTPNPGNSTSRIELWMDGTKLGNFFSNEVRTQISAASGSHALTAVEVDSSGAVLKSTPVTFTVH